MSDPEKFDAHLAEQIQLLLLPKAPPVRDWCCIGVKNQMASGVGGDFFDFLPTVDGCQLVMIGDVTGHGVAASVVMSLLYGYIHRSIPQHDGRHHPRRPPGAAAAEDRDHDHLQQQEDHPGDDSGPGCRFPVDVK